MARCRVRGFVHYTYDAIGNPTEWYNGTQMTWQKGRQLTGLYKTNTGSILSYTYDDSGLRTSKAINGVKTEYYRSGSRLIGQKRGSNVMQFLYDANGLYGFLYNGTPHYYVYNGQGDVVRLISASGATEAMYTYDAWGKPLSVTDASGNTISDASHIANVNPIRYRGYYYDVETGFYYLQSRYYAPEVGRFINAEPNADDGEFDDGSEILGYNVYAYCFNNPVNSFDPDGEAVANIVGGVIGGVAGAALGALLAKELGLSGWKKALFIAGVAAAGAALGAFLGPYMAKLGGKVAAKLGIKTAAKQTIKMSSSKLWKGSAKHIFSKDHIRNGIMRLGNSQKAIFNKLYEIVNSNLVNAVNGSNQIHTTINGIQITIRFYVSNGEVQSLDAMTGWATRIIGKLL